MKNLRQKIMWQRLATIGILILNLQLAAQNNNSSTNYYLLDNIEWSQVSPQEKKIIDSCLVIFHQAKTDTNKIKAINHIVENCWTDKIWQEYNKWVYNKLPQILSKETDPTTKVKLRDLLAGATSNYALELSGKGKTDEALNLYDDCKRLYEATNNLRGKAYLLHNIGFAIHKIGRTEEAVELLKESLIIHKQLKNDHGIGYCLNNIGYFYKDLGRLNEALDYFHESLDLRIKNGDKKNMITGYNNIAFIHLSQDENQKAEKYFLKCIELSDELNYAKGKATPYINLASIVRKSGDRKKAEEYYQNALKIYKSNSEPAGEALTLSHIASLKAEDDNLNEALAVYNEALVINQKINSKSGISTNLNSIGVIYLKQGKYKQAKNLLLKGLSISQELGYPNNIKFAARNLAEIYKQERNGLKALEMYELFISMRDSLKNENSKETLIKQQAKYEYENQRTIDKANHDKQLALKQEAKEKQEILTYATASGLALVGFFLLIVFNRLKVTRRQKNIIEEQKKEVEFQKEVVEQAHSELEEKNKEITDSIQYAKRIQSAILPPDKLVKECLKESFILYKPKDIVAGDFYWLEQIDDKILFAAADCTGHGVPGAMVSVICNNGLNRSVKEHKLTDPGEILTKTREIVVKEFEKSEEEVKDGMDIALCSLQGNVLNYAGAQNPLWIIRKDQEEIEEIKADKQPIGKIDKPQPYTAHNVELNQGDTIYIFSDGYADQFGGDKGKKMKTSNFKKLLLSIRKESMHKQKLLIDKAFENWKGELEQLDDVCVIGVRI